MSESKTLSIEQVQRYCLQGGRGLLLTSLVYVTWRFGGVDAVTLFHVSILLIATCLLAIVGQPKIGFRPKPLPVLLLVVIGLSVLWPVVQSIQLPQSVYNAVATGQHEVDKNLVDRTIEATFAALRPSVDATIESAAEHRIPRRSISVVTSFTDARIQQWILMAAVVLLSALLFDSRKSRRLFLWTLAINTALIATWGLIQRSTGSTDLLPGTTRSSVILPFGPFVYKNAGAAAAIPGFACAVGLLWASWLPRFGKQAQKRKSTAAKSKFGYRNAATFSDQRTFILLLICGLTSVGLLVSHSRGAWLATIVATIAILIVARRHVSARLAAGLVAIPVLVCLAIIAVPRNVAPIAEQIENQLSADYVYADGRWEHWKEGFRTAKKYFPVGSGLGTYGYATLAEQRSDTRLWFREAHNHYLETLTEQGVTGLLILVCGGLLLLRYSRALLNNQISRQRSAVGLAGLAAIVAIAVQSIIDFVVIIPAVMFLYAALFGMVAQTYVSPLRERIVRTIDAGEKQVTGKIAGWTSIPVLWVAPVLVVLVMTHLGLRGRVWVDQTMAQSRPIADSVPDDLVIDANLDRLNECIEQNPDRAELYQRRAYWQTARLRIALRRASAKAGNEMSWESTAPGTLIQSMMSLPMVNRYMIIDDFAIDPTLRKPLRSALADLQRSLELNPFVAQANLAAAHLATMAGIDQGPFVANVTRLARSNPPLQFAAGVIAYHSGNHNLMVDQWRRSLRVHTPVFPAMVRLCRQSMSLEEVITRLIPADRSGWLLPMVRSLDDEDIEQMRSDRKLANVLEDRITSDPSRSVGQQHALLGWIWTELDDPNRREQHWKAAMEADRANADYRYQYCQALLATGDYEEVLRQSALGLSLDQNGDRFKKVADTARVRLRTRTGRGAEINRF